MQRRADSKSPLPGLCAGSACLLLMALFTASPVLGDSNEPLVEGSVREQAGEASGDKGVYRQAAVYSGYRFITPVDNSAVAAPYMRLKPGVIGGFSAGSVGSDMKLAVNANFLHEDDYQTDLFFDFGGYYRLSLDSMALWHNLLRETLTPGALVPRELDPGLSYGVRTTASQVNNRIKMGNNPLHLNLGYWELTRDGYEQLIFSDHAFDGNQNSIISRTSRVDRVTREGSLGLDAHLGPVNVAYDFRIRDFSNNAPDNRDPFVGRDGVQAGIQAHDVIPDSRVSSHTIKLFSDLSGGLTGSAAYTLTQRENSAPHGDVIPASHPSDTLQSVAGGLSYSPAKELSFALKYRRVEINRDSPGTVFSPSSQIPANPPAVYTATPGLLLVRPSSNTVSDTVVLSAVYRPIQKAVYLLEYRAEMESRDNLPDPQALGNPAALRSDSRQTHTGKAGFNWKPYNGVKFNATYSYATCDNPAYPASFSERHNGQALLSYTMNGRWGATVSYLGRIERGENSAATDAASAAVSPSGAALFRLPRESRSYSANAAFWLNPLERLTITASYAFLQADIDQTVLFTSLSPGSLAATNYRSRAHVYGIDAVYALTNETDLSISMQQVFSDARFSVPSAAGFSLTDTSTVPPLTTDFSTAGISALTRLASTETGLAARADWRISRHFGCSLGYSFRLYDSGVPLLDGSVHETMLAVTARW